MRFDTMSEEVRMELATTAKAICSPGRGILAADESTGTIAKRFDSIGVENTEANRAAYRKLLFTTKGLGEYVSGCILFEETLYQEVDGVKMVDMLKNENIIPGIKVDKGLVSLPGTDNEKSTTGLDGLAERCKKYYEAGARFAKWRAVLEIDAAKCKPSNLSIQETAHTLARYAAICQQNKLVPIVEPEILTDGNHTVEYCAEITEKVLAAVFKALNDHEVMLEGCLLKPNMVTHGADCSTKASYEQIAFYTCRTLKRTVPPALVGVCFLSGGQSEVDATVNLHMMNSPSMLKTMNRGNPHMYALTFSYGRALQATVLKTWAGKPENVTSAQEALMIRAKANSQAQLGLYEVSKEAHANDSLYEKGYVY